MNAEKFGSSTEAKAVDPVVDQLGQVHFGIKDKDGFARNWDNPDASWNENAG